MFLGILTVAPGIARKGLGASDFHLALLEMGFGLGLVAAFLIGRISLPHRLLSLAVWPEVISSLILMLAAVTTGPDAFTAVLVAASAASMLAIPPRTAIYGMNYPNHARGRISSIVRISSMGGMVITGAGLGIWLDYNPDAYRIAFPIVGVCGLIGAAIFRTISLAPAPPEPSEPEKPPSSLTLLKQDPPFATFLVVFFLLGMANFITRPVITIFLVDPQYGIQASYFQLTLVYDVIPAFGSIIGLIAWGRLYDRTHPFLLRGAVNTLWIVDFAILVFAPSLIPIYVGRALMGFGRGGGRLLWAIGVISFAKPRRIPAYMGLHTMLTGIRALGGPALGVWLLNLFGSARPVFALAAGLSLASVILSFAAFAIFRARGQISAERPVAHSDV